MRPDITLKLLNERRYGPKAMKRRVEKCCIANPDCIHKAECTALYDQFVDSTEDTRTKADHQRH